MAILRNFTLDGSALRVIARVDQHGEQFFSPEFLHKFDREMNKEEFHAFAKALLEDVYEWYGLLHTYDGKFTNATIKEFLAEDEDDGIRMQPVPQG